MIARQLRYRDLKERGIVQNRVTLGIWIEKHGFPTGRMIGPNTRLWDEGEVAAWLASQPTAKKPTTLTLRHRATAELTAAANEAEA